MLLLTLLVVLLAQALSSVIWVSQLRASQMEGLLTSARSGPENAISSLANRPVAACDTSKPSIATTPSAPRSAAVTARRLRLTRSP